MLDGQHQKAYEITITATVRGTSIQASKTFNLVLKTPCIDTNFVNIFVANILSP